MVRLLDEQADDLAARVGAPLELVGVAVRGPTRHPDVPAELLTTDAAALVARDDVDIVVEVIGGIEPVRTLLLTALRSGKSVVSANKALLAEDGATLHDAAARGRRRPLLRGGGGRRDPACCARCGSRWPATASPG